MNMCRLDEAQTNFAIPQLTKRFQRMNHLNIELRDWTWFPRRHFTSNSDFHNLSLLPLCYFASSAPFLGSAVPGF